MRRMTSLAVVMALLSLAGCRNQTARSGSAGFAIKAVRVGIPPGPLAGDEDIGRRAPMFKAGHWTPVLVTLEGVGKLENAELVVQAVDSEDVFNEMAFALPAIEFSADALSYSTVVYARPGKTEGGVSVQLRIKGQNVGPAKEESLYALESQAYLYVSLGARMNGMRVPGSDEKSYRKSEVGSLDRVADLPSRWLGYHTADVCVLTTSNAEFASALLNDAAKREALLEWVRRGGKLVLCVGRNESLLKTREDLKEFLPVELNGTANIDSLRVNWNAVGDEIVDPQRKTPLTIARMTPKPGRGARVLVQGLDGATRHALVVQASYGMGKLTVLAADPDQTPFSKWKSQGKFWEQLLNEAGPRYAETKGGNELAMANAFSDSPQDSSAARLQSALETFDSVPVISFGWVALFIFVYILIVGPLDYLFLKKVVKRLELTWVTFPIVVVVVSVAAYATAYAIKGDEQKVNKLDLIDYDLRTRTAQGTTWFSIFSPRVQNYTLGVEPAEKWGLGEAISPPVVSWLGRPDNKRQSLFRRSYEYDPAGGLRRVPIQVWSTKGFQAAWYHRIDAQTPPFTVDLQGAGAEVTGYIVSHLPVKLNNVELYFKNNVYNLGSIAPGDSNRKQITTVSRRTMNERVKEMAQPAPVEPQQQPWARPSYQQRTRRVLDPMGRTLEEILLHEAAEAGNRTTRNAAFREYDQSWRVSGDSVGEDAILYGTVDQPAGSQPASDMGRAPTTATPLWVGGIPGTAGATYRDLDGKLQQETHVRVLIPVRTRN